MKKLIIAEKASQANDIRKAVSNDYVVVGASGHLFKLFFGNLKWSLDNLPIVPSQAILNDCEIQNYQLMENKKAIYQKIKKELDKNPVEIICATDPDFEGEAIYRTIIEYYQLHGGKVTNNQNRLILKDTTIDGIKGQMNLLQPITKYDGWRKRAYGRAYADALLGFNGTQVITLNSGNGDVIPIGRVIIPTLKLTVDRYLTNKNHIKEYTYAFDLIIDNMQLSSKTHRFSTKDELEKYLLNLNSKRKLSVKQKQKTIKPPKFHNLSTLQKKLNKDFKIKANDVLKALQFLYENKYTTYPRTDCTVVTVDTAKDLQSIIKSNQEKLEQIYNYKLTEEFNYNDQIIGKTSAHEGLSIKNIPEVGKLNEIQQKVYDEILKTNIANFFENMQVIEEDVTTEIEDNLYSQKFTKKLENNQSWDVIYKPSINFNLVDSMIEYDNKVVNCDYKSKEIESKPKALYTEGTLIDAMKYAGKDDEINKEIFKEIEGIGTPATRSGIIENLYKADYIKLIKDKIIPTEKGIDLIRILDEQSNPLVNISYTAELETKLRELEENNLIKFDEFIEYVKEVVNNIIEASNKNKLELKGTGPQILGKCPKCKNHDVVALKGKFGKYYQCKSEKCEFKITNYLKLSEKDVTLLINGKKTTFKKYKSKDNKEYRARFIWDNEKKEIKRLFT